MPRGCFFGLGGFRTEVQSGTKSQKRLYSVRFGDSYLTLGYVCLVWNFCWEMVVVRLVSGFAAQSVRLIVAFAVWLAVAAC